MEELSETVADRARFDIPKGSKWYDPPGGKY